MATVATPQGITVEAEDFDDWSVGPRLDGKVALAVKATMYQMSAASARFMADALLEAARDAECGEEHIKRKFSGTEK